jgi:hypothetical protein
MILTFVVPQDCTKVNLLSRFETERNRLSYINVQCLVKSVCFSVCLPQGYSPELTYYEISSNWEIWQRLVVPCGYFGSTAWFGFARLFHLNLARHLGNGGGGEFYLVDPSRATTPRKQLGPSGDASSSFAG